jgi:hypothetical protein
MYLKRMMTATCAAAILTAMSATPAHAQTMDSRTEFTFNQPVEMPGVTLPPGTYIFRFADTSSGKSVMQVQAKDASSKQYGFFLTISAQRPRASNDAELRFLETPAGQPAAVKTWWYPGNTTGREFIYPKSQARRLAQATNQTVLTTRGESATNDQMKSADLAYVSPSGQETPLTDEQLVDVAANTPPVGAASAPVQERTTASASTRTRLPKTSTAFPMVGLAGLLSLLGAATLRYRR